MKKAITLTISLLVLLAVVAGCAPAASIPTTVMQNTPVGETVRPGAVGNEYQRTINVVGSGQVFLVPDVAYVYIGVHSQSDNVTTALKDNNEQARAVTEALKGLNVEEKDIQTTSFNIYPQQQYEPGTGTVTGTFYSVDNTVYVTVRDLKRLGELLDTVVRSGANSINGINFDVIDKETALTKARELAIENARKQAEELAKVSNVTPGEILSVTSGYATSPMAKEAFYGMGGGGGMASSAAPVSAGQLVLSADVSITYSIK